MSSVVFTETFIRYSLRVNLSTMLITFQIEALPEIVEAVKKYNVEVYLDGGVSTGTDVFKALALGARCVFVGRPALWGLTVGGQAGVLKMLQIFRNELDYTVQIAGK